MAVIFRLENRRSRYETTFTVYASCVADGAINSVVFVAQSSRTPIHTTEFKLDSGANNKSGIDRRTFLAGLAAGTGALALSACGASSDGGGSNTGGPAGSAGVSAGGTSANEIPSPSGTNRYTLPRPVLPDPTTSGIDHIVLVTMENRSFDHFMSWVPGAEGMPPNQLFTDNFAQQHAPFLLSANPDYGFQACNFADPNHSFAGGRIHLANGAMNGFLLSTATSETQGDLLPIGFYQAADLDFFRGVASQYTVSDFYFSGILSETFPNRIYLHAGATDRLSNTTTVSTLPTIWDNLAAKNVSATYFYHDTPFTALFGNRYTGISQMFPQFLTQAANGTLPSFCMIDPIFSGEAQGVSADDHPHADIRNGEGLLGQIYDALRTGPNWDRTLMIVVYDEWGGFHDHVIPPTRPMSDAETTLGNDGKLGFRVPCVLLGPRVPAATVTRFPFDPSSIHQLIQWRFGIDPVGVRGNAPGTFNLAYALDFASPARTDAPAIPVAPGPFGSACPIPAPAAPASGASGAAAAATMAAEISNEIPRFTDVRELADTFGFPRP
jgi:phospholipase C